MSAVGVVQYALWIFAPVVQAAIVVLMVRKGIRREYPLFFNYLLLEIAGFAILFGAYHLGSSSQYFYSYWTVGTLTALFELAAINEAFRASLKQYAALREMAGILTRWVVVVLVVIAFLSALTAPGNNADRLAAGVLSFQRSVCLMQCGLVAFLVLFARHLKLSFRTRAFALAVGFGISAVAELVMVTVMEHYLRASLFVSVMNSAAYCGAVALWFNAMRLPEPALQPTTAMGEATTWNLALSAPSSDIQEEAFLPHLERTVERVLARRRVNLVQ